MKAEPSRVDEEVEKLFFKHRDEPAFLVGLSLWSANPTSASAGYGVKENYSYIASSLEYQFPDADVDRVVDELRAECDKSRLNLTFTTSANPS